MQRGLLASDGNKDIKNPVVRQDRTLKGRAVLAALLCTR